MLHRSSTPSSSGCRSSFSPSSSAISWVWSVTPALHTPLMSVTNAISSVIVVGALLAVGVGMISSGSGWARGFGFIALIFACVNIFGGFLVTQRMLAMYKKKVK
ncbi:NAD(P) transhydrogenase subunit alpha [Bradyrhizobium sp. USDA 3051]